MNNYKQALLEIIAAYDVVQQARDQEAAWLLLGDCIHEARELLGHVQPVAVQVADRLKTDDRVGP